MPGNEMSSTYRPLPWMKRGSSFRFIATPREPPGFGSVLMSVPRVPRHAVAADAWPSVPAAC